MKLNLLPTYVSKEKSARAAWFLSIVIAAAAIIAAVFMRVVSQNDLQSAKDAAQQYTANHQRALAASKDADAIIAQARQIIVDIDLAQAMMQHNSVYPDLYDKVQGYIPGFFRLTSISASPSGAQGCTVTMQGVLRTHQEYADLMLALLRIPGAIAVSRDGYQITDQQVPALNETDQSGRPVRPGEDNIPDDPMARLEYLMSQGVPQGFTGEGGFGTDSLGPRGAMPGWSLITVSVTLPDNLQTPDPRATLTAAGSGAPTAPAGGVPTPAPGPRGGQADAIEPR